MGELSRGGLSLGVRRAAFDPACDYCYPRSTLWHLDRPRIFTNVGDLAPKRITLGCLRADRGLLRRGDGVFAALDPLEEPDGLARYPRAERICTYQEAIGALSGRSPVGLCEETADAWTAVGLDREAKTCTCAT